MKKFPMTIGQMAKLLGTSPENIRYYEREHLLPAPGRTAGGHRLYVERHYRQLTFVLRARELGFTQAEVRTLLAIAEESTMSCADVKDIAELHLVNVRNKISDLNRLEAALSDLVIRCRKEGRAGTCPVVESLYEPTVQT